MRVFFDTEFTGLHQKTTLISIGLVAETGDAFYAELTDYDARQLNDWLNDHVIRHLWCESGIPATTAEHEIYAKGKRDYIAAQLRQWLETLGRYDYETGGSGKLEMWSDVLAYDWILFCELFGGAMQIPECVYYIPFDLATLLAANRIGSDIDREHFAEMSDGPKHNALWDAKVIRACYQRIAGWNP